MQPRPRRLALGSRLEGAAFLCFLVLVTLIPFIHSSRAASQFVVVKQLLFEPGILLCLLLWTCSMALRGKPVLVKSRLYLFAALFLGACLLSFVGAVPRFESGVELRAWVAAAIGFLLAVNLVRTRARVWAVLAGVSLAGILEALLALGQFLDLHLLFRVRGDVAGTLGNSNYVGGFLALACLPLIAMVLGGLRSPSCRRFRGFVPAAGALALAALGAGLLVTDCQSAYIGAALGILALVATLLAGRDRPKATAVVAAVTLLVLAVAASPGDEPSSRGTEEGGWSRFFRLDERATKGRILIWNATLLIVRDHPLLGTGIGTYAFYYPDYLAESLEGTDVKPIRHLLQFVKKPHNAYLQLWSETGTLGLGAFLLLLLVYFVDAVSLRRRLTRIVDRYAWAGIVCGQIAFAATIVVSSLLIIAPLRELFWIFLGLPAGLRHAVGAGEEQSWSPPVRLRKTFLALLVALPAAALVLGANRSLRLYAANVYWAGGLRAKDAGRLPQAIDRYSRALELTPEQHELFFLRGSVLAGMSEAESDPARSKELARRGLSDLHRAARGFSDVTLFANLGKLHADLGDHETSLEWHRREAGTGLNYAAAHTKVGVELLALGRLDEAAVELEEALEVQPDLDWARFHLGMVRWRQGRHEEAADCFRRYLFRNPDSVEGHNNLGLMLMETGRLAEAVQAFETALRAEPDNVPVLNNLGAAHFRMGRVDLARRRWARALEIDPGNEIARENLSRWGDAGR